MDEWAVQHDVSQVSQWSRHHPHPLPHVKKARLYWPLQLVRPVDMKGSYIPEVRSCGTALLRKAEGGRRKFDFRKFEL